MRSRPIIALSITFLLTVTSVQCQQTILVETKNGQVKGTIVTVENQKAARFVGIPYAEPPIGSLRFQVQAELFAQSKAP